MVLLYPQCPGDVNQVSINKQIIYLLFHEIFFFGARGAPPGLVWRLGRQHTQGVQPYELGGRPGGAGWVPRKGGFVK